jgi:hypothetical protein
LVLLFIEYVIRRGPMPYLNSREVAAIALLSALWGVLASVFAPIVFRVMGLPILCDMIGFAVLTLAAWWIRKLGAVSMVGVIATLINFIFNPGGVHFLGFTAASMVFDAVSRLIGYERSFRSPSSASVSMLLVSVLSAAVAGFIIGTFFMAAPALARWGGVIGWVALHAVGGAIGGVVGVILIISLSARGIRRAEVRA